MDLEPPEQMDFSQNAAFCLFKLVKFVHGILEVPDAVWIRFGIGIITYWDKSVIL